MYLFVIQFFTTRDLKYTTPKQYFIVFLQLTFVDYDISDLSACFIPNRAEPQLPLNGNKLYWN